MTGWVFGWLLVVMAEVGELGSSEGTSSVLSPFYSHGSPFSAILDVCMFG